MQSSTFILICIEPSAFFFGMNVFCSISNDMLQRLEDEE